MKTKKSDIAVKIFLVVVAVILVGLIIAWSTGVFKDKKKDLSKGTEKINNAIGSVMDYDIQMYCEGGISGDTLVDLIERVRKEQLDLAVKVITKDGVAAGTIYTAEDTPTLATEKTNPEYINRNGSFKGEIDEDEEKNNDIIIGITFRQH